MAATAVTPVGVRDGDPDALAGLCDRRGPAVLAYCEVVAGRGDVAVAAAAEAFASFRVGVVAAPDLANLNPEALLISATRHAAARYAGGGTPEPHSRVSALLAARADRSITLADHDWLEQHLAECWTCRAPVARFEAADRAYRDPPRTRLDPEVAAVIVAALAAAAPVRGAVGPEPTVFTNGSGRQLAPPEPEPEPQPEYVEQPTAAWQAGIDDAGLHDAPMLDDDAAAARRERRSAPRPSKRGLTRQPRTERKRDAPKPRRADADRPPPQAGVQRARSSRDERAAAAAAAVDTPPASTSRTGGGASLPRPQRTAGSRPSASRRSRGSLRPGVVLPVALVVLAIIVALLIAGVFGGAEPASAPQSFAPSPTEPANPDAAPVVVVPGAATASAAAVERAKAKARAAKRREDAAKAAGEPTASDSATALPTPVTPPPPPADTRADTSATPANRGTDQGSGGASPKIDAGKDATGAEDIPGTQDTSTVPELAPPAAGPAPPG